MLSSHKQKQGIPYFLVLTYVRIFDKIDSQASNKPYRLVVYGKMVFFHS